MKFRQQHDSPWPHRVAMLLACATFPLIWVGGLVTTYDAGMAVPDWPSTYGYNLFLYPWQTWLYGPWDLFVEHGHRLLGATVGLITIALVLVVWTRDQRRWVKYLALAALVLVIFQGVLGGLRVLENDRQLAKIHGCVGPAFFALCVALCVFTSRMWRNAKLVQTTAGARTLHRFAILTAVFAFAQLVLGAQLRHISFDMSHGTFRVLVLFHLLVALVVTVHVIIVAALVFRHDWRERALSLPAAALCGLVLLQVALGGATWVVKYSWPDWFADTSFAAGYTIQAEGWWQSNVVTAHMATGSLIVATAVLLALRSLRLRRQAAEVVNSEMAWKGATA